MNFSGVVNPDCSIDISVGDRMLSLCRGITSNFNTRLVEIRKYQSTLVVFTERWHGL